MRNFDPNPLLASALAAQQRGDAASAESGYREVLHALPGQPVAQFNLGHLLLQQGRLAEATALLAASLAADPLHPLRAVSVRELGLGLYRGGFREAARAWLAEAAISTPDDAEVAAALGRCRAPSWLAPEAFDASTGQTLRRAAPREADTYVYTLDVVGTCNLRCPSCPVGNLPKADRATGFMPMPLYESILAKIADESPVTQPQIWLFNWGEPLLHPQLPAMIRAARGRGWPVHLSSNLNIRHGLDAVIAAAPSAFKVSISGFSQATYGVTHRRGKLEQVIANLRALRESIDRHRVDTHVWVGQHVYRSNQHEVAPLNALCRELGFAHHPIAAYLSPLENLLRIAEGQAAELPVIEDLLQPPHVSIRRHRAGRDPRYDCELRANQTVINHDGSVALCCTVYEAENQLGVSFIDTPRAQIEARKYAHPTCARCQQQGLQLAPMKLTAQ